jgi:hypothetical protein
VVGVHPIHCPYEQRRGEQYKGAQAEIHFTSCEQSD